MVHMDEGSVQAAGRRSVPQLEQQITDRMLERCALQEQRVLAWYDVTIGNLFSFILFFTATCYLRYSSRTNEPSPFTKFLQKVTGTPSKFNCSIRSR